LWKKGLKKKNFFFGFGGFGKLALFWAAKKFFEKKFLVFFSLGGPNWGVFGGVGGKKGERGKKKGEGPFPGPLKKGMEGGEVNLRG
jgi:hypothetical protein